MTQETQIVASHGIYGCMSESFGQRLSLFLVLCSQGRRPSKSDFFARSEFTFIKFCAELCAEIAQKTYKI